jgi:5-methylcytosine-specific restriction endonuclease McrA
MSRDEVGDRLLSLRQEDSRIHRCSGTAEEVDRWRRGTESDGWEIRGGTPRPGDLLLGVGGSPAYVIDVVPVERVYRRGHVWTAEWDPARDIALRPPVAMSALLSLVQTKIGANWQVLEGGRAAQFLEALVKSARNHRSTTDTEAQRRLSSCRRRSQRNRRDAIERARGRCQACKVDFRRQFGAIGDRALEAHHRRPLAQQREGLMLTSSNDLVVLCATCHRLTHVSDLEDWQAVGAAWLAS